MDDYTKLIGALFDRALEIARSPFLRGNMSAGSRALLEVTNAAWDNEWARKGVPGWYRKAESVSRALLGILQQPVLDVPEQEGYQGRADLALIGVGVTPGGFENWEAHWETVVIPQINALKEQTFKDAAAKGS